MMQNKSMRQTKKAIVCGLYAEEFIHIRKCVCLGGWCVKSWSGKQEKRNDNGSRGSRLKKC